MFMGPLDKSKPWSTKGLQGCYRFLQKVWRLFYDDTKSIDENCSDKATTRLLHQTIKKVTIDLDSLRFNTVVSQLMIFTNHLTTLKNLDKVVLHQFLVLLNPFAPHLSEELNQKLGFESITSVEWPDYDEKLISEQNITLAVQFNGKTRGTIDILKDAKEADALKMVRETSFGKKYLETGELRKIIYIPGRIMNIIVS